jgi:exonuclease I
MEDMPHAKRVLRNISVFYSVFKDDPMLDESSGIKELRIEYFIISTYLLLRHVTEHYVFDDAEHELFHNFVMDFHTRWRARREEDNDILIFSDNRQQSAGEIEVRDRIIRQIFFEYVSEQGYTILTKDERRGFNEAERIRIYRRDEGLCQMCLDEGKPEREAQVSWSDYEADHVIPHAKGGRTDVENAQVLCCYHNKQKSAKL